MTAEKLHAAANSMYSAAQERLCWAASSESKALANLHTQVAQELQDRAAQVRCWATSAAYRAAHHEPYPADVAAQIENAVREFLAMAGVRCNAA